MDGRKKLSEDRRTFILDWLKTSNEPLTGQAIAIKMNVSRQVIVQDISLLKAKDEPIIATAQGYLYVHEKQSKFPFKRIIASRHMPDHTEKELNILVDHGVFIRDVIVDHPIYGELTASLMIRNRRDVQQFIQKMKQTNASYLLDLTDGTHLHTIEAETESQLDEACTVLEKVGYILNLE